MNLKIKPTFQLKRKNLIKNTIKLTFLNEILTNVNELKKLFGSLTLSYKTKLEYDLKIFDVLKEDKLKNMKMTSLNMNAGRIRGYINDVNNSLDKLIPFIEKFKQIFKKVSWEFSELKDSAIYRNYTATHQINSLIEFNEKIVKEYQSIEKGVSYNEGIKNKKMIT